MNKESRNWQYRLYDHIYNILKESVGEDYINSVANIHIENYNNHNPDESLKELFTKIKSVFGEVMFRNLISMSIRREFKSEAEKIVREVKTIIPEVGDFLT